MASQWVAQWQLTWLVENQTKCVMDLYDNGEIMALILQLDFCTYCRKYIHVFSNSVLSMS